MLLELIELFSPSSKRMFSSSVPVPQHCCIRQAIVGSHVFMTSDRNTINKPSSDWSLHHWRGDKNRCQLTCENTINWWSSFAPGGQLEFDKYQLADIGCHQLMEPFDTTYKAPTSNVWWMVTLTQWELKVGPCHWKVVNSLTSAAKYLY